MLSISEEKIFELAIESGADECIHNNDFHEIQCSMSEIYNVKKKLENMIKNFISTEIEWLPIINADVSQDRVETITQLLETLEEEEDVQSVFTNFKIRKNK